MFSFRKLKEIDNLKELNANESVILKNLKEVEREGGMIGSIWLRPGKIGWPLRRQ
jgi:hypothetical protein